MKIKYGECHCGCREKTNLASQTSTQKGWIRGKPKKFIAYHYSRIQSRRVKKNRYIINQKTGCWEWQLYTYKAGHGTTWYNGKHVLAHRYYYEKYKGKIPKELELDHLCKNPSCVNSKHLEAVTHTENVRRGKNTKLTKKQVSKIKRLYRDTKITTYKLAKMFSVDRGHISSITTGRSWSDIK